MKLFVALVAFLAVQGWTSASSIRKALTGTAANPENCLPYIQDVYNIAVDGRSLVGETQTFGQKFMDGIEKCLDSASNEDAKKCFEKFEKEVVDGIKPMKDAYLKLAPKTIDVMDKFDKCMAGQTQVVSSRSNPEKCLPYVQEAYDTAVKVRPIARQIHEFGKKLGVGFLKCRAESETDAKKTCFKNLHNQVIVDDEPIKDAVLKIHPKIVDLMDKFEKCLA